MSPSSRRSTALLTALTALTATTVLGAGVGSASAGVAPAGSPVPAGLAGASFVEVPNSVYTPLRAGDVPRTTYVPEVVRSAVSGRATPGQAGVRLAATPLSSWQVTYIGAWPAEAKAAYQRAVDIWARLVASAVPIRVSATWADLHDPGLLGQTGPTALFYNGATQDSPSYPVALFEAATGKEQNSGAADVAAEFNSASGTAWYFGTDRPAPDQTDFTTVVLHELGHGLGLLGTMGKTGSIGSYGFDDDGDGVGDGSHPAIYDSYVRSAAPTDTALLGYTNKTAALGSALTSRSLTWTGPLGVGATGTAPRLYAPAQWEDGSSFSHLDEAAYPPGDPNSLMTPFLDPGETIRDPGDIALAMLEDMGFPSPIEAHYLALGGSASFLGQPTGPEQVARDGEGRSRTYRGGTIWWSPASGAAEVHGLIRDTWTVLGAERSALGYPSTDERQTPDARGRFNQFVNGSVYWSPASGAHEVRGAIRATWAGLGYERGPLGYPTSDELAAADGQGRYGRFQAGSIYWRTDTGAHEVRGLIRDTWLRLGAERSALGYPVSDELATPDGRGRYEIFQAGGQWWTPSTGAHEVRGAILSRWGALGNERGPLGYPVTNELGSSDGVGRYNDFQQGSIYWSPSTYAHEVRGAIRGAWAARGKERGSLGYPVTDEYAVPGGRAEDFQGGRLVWSAATGVVVQTGR